jgi:hypothetical protein
MDGGYFSNSCRQDKIKKIRGFRSTEAPFFFKHGYDEYQLLARLRPQFD